MISRHQWTMFAVAVLVCAPFLLAGEGRLTRADTPELRAAAGRTPIVLFMSWDGTPAWLLDKLLAAGKMPNVARLIADGAKADYSIGNWASKTAAGHAAVFTGAFGDVSGIPGNAVGLMPSAGHTIVEGSVSGYSSANLMAEPFWIAAIRQGRRAAAVSVTQSQPFEMYTQPGYVSEQGLPGFAKAGYGDRLWMVDGYGSRTPPLDNPAVVRAKDVTNFHATDATSTHWTNLPGPGPFHEFTLTLANSTFNGLLIDPPHAPSDGPVLAQMALSRGTDWRSADAVLETAPPSATGIEHFSAPVKVAVPAGTGGTGGTPGGGQDAYLYLRLYDVAADGSNFLLWRSSASAIGTAMTRPADAAALVAAAGAFTGNARLWSDLGTLLPDGGDGTAERRYVETAILVMDWFRRATAWSIRQDQADAYFTYSPYPDEVHHIWYGLIDPTSPQYDAAMAAKLWPLEETVMAYLDRFLGETMDALAATGRPWNMVLFTDHGFLGVNKTFYPNRVLKAAGLASADAAGKVDVAATKALYAPENNADVLINSVPDSAQHAGHKGGTVPDGAWEQVMQDATIALLSARDPENGRPIVTGVFRPDQHRGFGIGGPHGGDLYLDLAPGYAFSPGANNGAIVTARGAYASGDHIQLSYRTTLQGIAVLGGTQIRDLGRISAVRSIDLAPTLARAVGLEPPAQAQGHILGELMEPEVVKMWANFLPRAERAAGN